MEKSLKFYLSLSLVLLLFSCNDNDKESSLVYLEYSQSFYQGTKENLNLLSKSIELDSENVDSWREFSIPFLKRGIPHIWKKNMDKSIEIDPKEWQAWRGYNYLWFYRDYKKAIADFDEADNVDANFIAQAQGHSVDYWRGIAYLGLKDYKNSNYYFDKLIEKETEETGEDWVEVTAFLFNGIAHYENNNDSLALHNIDKLLKYTNNNYADGNYYKALILEKNGNVKDAIELTNLAIENYEEGYYNYRGYVETLRQIYMEDLLLLKERLTKKQ